MVSAIRVDCLVSRIRVSGVNRFVIYLIYLGVIRFTHLKTRVAFLYLTLSENESQFSLENISADISILIDMWLGYREAVTVSFCLAAFR